MDTLRIGRWPLVYNSTTEEGTTSEQLTNACPQTKSHYSEVLLYTEKEAIQKSLYKKIDKLSEW